MSFAMKDYLALEHDGHKYLEHESSYNGCGEDCSACAIEAECPDCVEELK